MSNDDIVLTIGRIRGDAKLSQQEKNKLELAYKNMLYSQIHKLLRFYCMKYFNYAASIGYEETDVLGAAWVGVEKAVDKFESGIDYRFSTFIRFHVHNAVAEFLGLRGAKKSPKETISLSAPVTDDENITLEETISDECAAKSFEDAESNLYFEPLRAEVDKLPGDMRSIIKGCYFKGYNVPRLARLYNTTQSEIRNTKIKALRKLKHNAVIRKNYLEDFSYRYVGTKTFKSTWTSSTEWAVLMLEDIF